MLSALLVWLFFLVVVAVVLAGPVLLVVGIVRFRRLRPEVRRGAIAGAAAGVATHLAMRRR